MAAHKSIDKICCIVLVLTLALTIFGMNSQAFGTHQTTLGYEDRLFDTSRVHTIDIVMDDWEGFLAECTDEAYTLCDVVIDQEVYRNVAIRAKGNTSLTNVKNYGNNRYSFKLEFDHYDSTKSYYGLDKLCLNNLIQDNTCMKDYLCYRLMASFGVDAPLCSYVQIRVNGAQWGLYLAVEGVEEAFLERSFGSEYGELYKPDSDRLNGGQMGGGQTDGNSGQGKPDSVGYDDVKLLYSGDAYDSYRNIFENAKTDITDEDQERLIASLKNLNSCTALEQTVDVEKVLRYFVVHNFVCNFDSYTGSMVHNYYLHEQNGQLSMIPWDYNLAFGGFGGGDAESMVNFPIDSPVTGGTLESRPMVAWIFSDEEYTRRYHVLFAEFLTAFFDHGELAQMIEETRNRIAPYMESDPTAFCTYDQFETGTASLQLFCQLRAESVRGQLDGTVPATSEAQAMDSDARIDASGLSLSDMGSMNGGMGGEQGGFPQKPGDGEQVGFPQQPEDGEQGGFPQQPEDGEQGGFPQQPEDGEQGSFPQPPGDGSGLARTKKDAAGEADSMAGWIVLGVSCAVLTIGVAAAFFYRKRAG